MRTKFGYQMIICYLHEMVKTILMLEYNNGIGRIQKTGD